jgi:scyllo-inositol 2-dehydrogenase (NADP+)
MAIGVGVIGVGRVASELHLPDLAKLKAFRISGVYDVSEERAGTCATKYGARVFPSYEAMLADPKIALVVVTTPSNSHAEFAIQALEARKNVVVDKPTATTLKEVESMFAAADRAGRLLLTYQNRRWDQDFVAVREVVAEGLLGDLVLVESRITGCGEAGWGEFGVFGDKWRLQKAYGGGYLLDWGPHMVDQALLLVGAPIQSVFADVRGGVWSKDADDHFVIVIRFANGTIANCVGSAVVRYGGYRWFVTGTNGTLKQVEWDAPTQVLYHKGGKQIEITHPRPKTTWLAFYENLAKVLAGKAEPVVKREETLRVFRVFEAARKSARTGNSVRLDR